MKVSIQGWEAFRTTNMDEFYRTSFKEEKVVCIYLGPGIVTVPRRMAFRYLKIELLGRFSYHNFYINDMECFVTTSVAKSANPLSSQIDPEIIAILYVGMNILKKCMQPVYEDGPKK